MMKSNVIANLKRLQPKNKIVTYKEINLNYKSNNCLKTLHSNKDNKKLTFTNALNDFFYPKKIIRGSMNKVRYDREKVVREFLNDGKVKKGKVKPRLVEKYTKILNKFEEEAEINYLPYEIVDLNTKNNIPSYVPFETELESYIDNKEEKINNNDKDFRRYEKALRYNFTVLDNELTQENIIERLLINTENKNVNKEELSLNFTNFLFNNEENNYFDILTDKYNSNTNIDDCSNNILENNFEISNNEEDNLMKNSLYLTSLFSILENTEYKGDYSIKPFNKFHYEIPTDFTLYKAKNNIIPGEICNYTNEKPDKNFLLEFLIEDIINKDDNRFTNLNENVNTLKSNYFNIGDSLSKKLNINYNIKNSDNLNSKIEKISNEILQNQKEITNNTIIPNNDILKNPLINNISRSNLFKLEYEFCNQLLDILLEENNIFKYHMSYKHHLKHDVFKMFNNLKNISKSQYNMHKKNHLGIVYFNDSMILCNYTRPNSNYLEKGLTNFNCSKQLNVGFDYKTQTFNNQNEVSYLFNVINCYLNNNYREIDAVKEIYNYNLNI